MGLFYAPKVLKREIRIPSRGASPAATAALSLLIGLTVNLSKNIVHQQNG
jgi:hypothetical protein